MWFQHQNPIATRYCFTFSSHAFSMCKNSTIRLRRQTLILRLGIVALAVAVTPGPGGAALETKQFCCKSRIKDSTSPQIRWMRIL